MGGHPYWYIVAYDADLEAVLEEVTGTGIRRRPVQPSDAVDRLSDHGGFAESGSATFINRRSDDGVRRGRHAIDSGYPGN